MNVLCIVGNLGQDAELKYLPSGAAILNFSVACSSGYGDKKKTTWVRCALFGKQGEALERYLKKGSKVFVSGEFSLNEYKAERIEAELKAEQDRIEAERMFALLWDEAHIMNDRFDIDKEKAEIAKAKQAEQDEKDRLSREAELVEQGRLAAEQANKQALEKAEREKLEAEQREKQAIEHARIAKEKAELLEKQRIIDAENSRVAALEKAERERLQAIEDERKRVEAESAKQKAIDDARKADIEHRTAIKTSVKELLIASGLTDEQAINVVKLACAGKLGALKIEF